VSFSEEDVDPGMFFADRPRDRGRHNKVRQLCKQVERAAGAVLAGECGEEALLEAWVAEVRPGPDASRLVIVVVLGASASVVEARAALARASARFRGEVARSIVRKRVPEVAFEVLVQEQRTDE
jgi:ribosome-binding factor A